MEAGKFYVENNAEGLGGSSPITAWNLSLVMGLWHYVDSLASSVSLGSSSPLVTSPMDLNFPTNNPVILAAPYILYRNLRRIPDANNTHQSGKVPSPLEMSIFITPAVVMSL